MPILALCPRCKVPLVSRSTPNGMVFGCPKCQGNVVALAVLRRAGTPEPFLREVWQAGRSPAAFGSLKCPHCNHPMAEVESAASGQLLTVDVCRRCAAIWFDTREYESIPRQQLSAATREMAPAARRAAALLEVERIAHQDRWKNGGIDTEGPDQPWQWILAILGLPVECEAPGLTSIPWVTWGIGALMVAIFLATVSHLEAAVGNWGFIPAEWYRHGGLTLLTSFLLHGGVFHLLGNLYFFLIFGDNVEDHLGRWSFVLLLGAAHMAGMVAHGVLDPRPDIPCVGASAGISGVMAYYVVAFPHVKVGVLWRYFFFFRWFRMPAFMYIGFFILMQIIGSISQIGGFGYVSYLAHFGGIVVGFVLGAVVAVRRKRKLNQSFARI